MSGKRNANGKTTKRSFDPAADQGVTCLANRLTNGRLMLTSKRQADLRIMGRREPVVNRKGKFSRSNLLVCGEASIAVRDSCSKVFLHAFVSLCWLPLTGGFIFYSLNTLSTNLSKSLRYSSVSQLLWSAFGMTINSLGSLAAWNRRRPKSIGMVSSLSP